MADAKLSLKLLVDKKSQQVLFAEADKKFVDFLLCIFTLPVGTVIRLLQNQTMTGSLRPLYESIENLSDIYIQPDQSKHSLLQPKVSLPGAQVPLLFPSSQRSDKSRIFYCCASNTRNYSGNDSCNYYTGNYSSGYHTCKSVTDDWGAVCPRCHKSMDQEVSYVGPPSAVKPSTLSEGGYVKGVVTYMVMDNLEIKPMSTISAITLLGKLSIRDIGAIEEKVVDVGKDEGVRLLAASLQSKTVLTDVFLGDQVEKVIGKVSDDVGGV